MIITSSCCPSSALDQLDLQCYKRLLIAASTNQSDLFDEHLQCLGLGARFGETHAHNEKLCSLCFKQAFGNARTAVNNNSSRFGKFIQLNYLESGVIRGAVLEKYLLEKCRLVSRDKSERNYHVFYYLLVGASKEEQEEFHLLKPQDYLYLKQEDFRLDDEEKLKQEYKRLHQAMEMVGFLASTKKQYV